MKKNSFKLNTDQSEQVIKTSLNTKLCKLREARRSQTVNTLRSCKRRSRKSKSCSNLQSSQSFSENNEAESKYYYTLDSLLKRWTDFYDTLDRDLHFEFLEIKKYPANKSFKESLKIQNEKKSRYKYIYPCNIF